MCEEEWRIHVRFYKFLGQLGSVGFTVSFSFPARLTYIDDFITSFMFMISFISVSAAQRGSAMLTVTAGMARPAGTRGAEGAAGVRMIGGLLTLSRDDVWP